MKLKTLTTILVAVLVVAGISVPSFAQHRDRSRVERQHEPRYQPDYRQHRRYDRPRYRRGGGRVVILPRLTLRFPTIYRGRPVASLYNVGYRDGFDRGREDFKQGWPCATDFTFSRYNSDYEQGFRKGYADSCGGGR